MLLGHNATALGHREQFGFYLLGMLWHPGQNNLLRVSSLKYAKMNLTQASRTHSAQFLTQGLLGIPLVLPAISKHRGTGMALGSIQESRVKVQLQPASIS